MLQMPRVEHMGAVEPLAACVIQWIRQRQVVVQNGADSAVNVLPVQDLLWEARPHAVVVSLVKNRDENEPGC